MKNKILGIIGGGQLGRMIALSASHLGIKCHIYDPNPDSPAFDVASGIFNNEYSDIEAVKKFANGVDVCIYEFENIPIRTAQTIENLCPLRPSSKVLAISQDRLLEKKFLSDKAKIKTAPFYECNNIDDLKTATKYLNKSAILKTRRLGYDGKGQVRINKDSNLETIWKKVGDNQSIVEGFISFQRELSVIIARSIDADIKIYDCVENRHKNHILDETIAPAPHLKNKVRHSAEEIAIRIANELNLIGLLAVEMFEMEDGELVVNEIAPRPHNSGHWTMDGCTTSQFEQSVRAAMGWPLGSTLRNVDIVMKNLIGKEINLIDTFLEDYRYKTYLYGKKEVREGRKMGHINRIIEKDSNVSKFMP